MVEWEQLLSSFTVMEIALMVVNAVLLLISKPLFNKLSHGQVQQQSTRRRLTVFRSINALIIALLIFYHLLLPVSGASWVTKIVSVLFVVYLSHLGFYIVSYFVLSRFGRVREVDGDVHVGDTYNTRALRILSAILFVVIALIGSIQVLEFDSLLQAGGVIGFVGVMLALTQASWAPDIISGLIILNSDLMEEGDVIQLEGMDEHFIGVVYKTKMFHTEILNIINNHRMMIRNARLRDHTIHNLSKFASAKGLREMLNFKIGYEHKPEAVRQLFEDAFKDAAEDADIEIESQHPLEINVVEAGDYAVHWRVFYYTKNIRRMVRTRQVFTELILKHAAEHNISLATPLLHQNA